MISFRIKILFYPTIDFRVKVKLFEPFNVTYSGDNVAHITGFTPGLSCPGKC